MHNGAFKNLESVIKHYNDIKISDNLDKNMWIIKHSKTASGLPPVLNITPTETKQIIAYLNALKDDSLMVKKEYSNPFR
jgi:cytochrome c peroxidase